MEKKYIFENKILTSGTKIKGIIHNEKLIGKIEIIGDNIYFCQDRYNGASCNNKHGYKYSYVFTINNSRNIGPYTFIDICFIKKIIEGGISLEKKFKTSKFLKYLDIKMNDNNDLTVLFTESKFYINEKKELEEIKLHSEKLFMQRKHPDCCGSIIYYNFCTSNNNTDIYRRYKNLTEEDYIKIKDYINDTGAAKMAHLANQLNAKKFVKKLGFKLKFQYKNNNSGNTISVYHYNPSM